MRNKYMLIGVGIVVGVLLTSVVVVLAGQIDSPAGPTAVGGQMYTLENIYDRLTSQGNATKMTTFTEPAVGPGSTMHTLDDIYDLAWPARVPKTGAGDIASYTEDANEDGSLQKGVSWPNPRFTKSSGMVTDNLTGLIWLEDANCMNTEYSTFDTDGTADGRVTWQHALDFVAGINAGTYSKCGASQTDWRLPNVREMQSLAHYGVFNPAVPDTAGTAQLPCTAPPNCGDGDPFNNVQGGYWSSTTYAGQTASAWYVDLGNGHMLFYGKTEVLYVWPVRGGQ